MRRDCGGPISRRLRRERETERNSCQATRKSRGREVAKDGCEDEENEPPLEKSCDRKDGRPLAFEGEGGDAAAEEGVKEAAAEKGVKEALN